MTLPVAPSSIAASQINTELGSVSTATFSVDSAPSRTLAGLPTPSSTISWADFYGKTALFTTLGNCYCGGWYLGCTTSGAGGNYYLIAAPWSGGGAICEYFRLYGPATAGPANTCVCQCLPFIAQACSYYDGYYMTKFIQACPGYNPPAPISLPTCTWTYPMGAVTAGRSINGFADWYVPAQSELCTLFCNSDTLWRCGGPAKTAGSAAQWPSATIYANTSPIFSGAPGCLPYLGYTAGVTAPGGSPAPAFPQNILALGCNSGIGNPWTCPVPTVAIAASCGLLVGAPAATAVYLCMATMTVPCLCPPVRCPIACNGQYFQMSLGSFCNRLLCSPGNICSAIYPQPLCWGNGSEQRYALRVTRAVRRQAF